MTFISDGRNRRRRVTVDAFGSIQSVDMGLVHSKTHAGAMFSSGHYFTAIADAAAVNMLFRIGPISMHGQFVVSVAGDANLEVFETADISATGTSVPIRNRKRTSSAVPGATVFHTPTISGDGTSLFKLFIPGGTKNSATGSVVAGFDEWVLQPSIDYLLRLTNISGAAIDASIAVHFYERDVG